MRKRNEGLTLIELLITMSILVIVMGYTIPSATQMLRNNQLSANTNDLIGTMHYARSEAIRRGMPIGICGSNDQSTCSGAADWSLGWIVWVDADNNGILDGAEEVTFVTHNKSATLNLLNTSGQGQLLYLPSGYAAIAPGTTMDFRLCDDRIAETGRNISINAVGSPHVSDAACS